MNDHRRDSTRSVSGSSSKSSITKQKHSDTGGQLRMHNHNKQREAYSIPPATKRKDSKSEVPQRKQDTYEKREEKGSNSETPSKQPIPKQNSVNEQKENIVALEKGGAKEDREEEVDNDDDDDDDDESGNDSGNTSDNKTGGSQDQHSQRYKHTRKPQTGLEGSEVYAFMEEPNVGLLQDKHQLNFSFILEPDIELQDILPQRSNSRLETTQLCENAEPDIIGDDRSMKPKKKVAFKLDESESSLCIVDSRDEFFPRQNPNARRAGAMPWNCLHGAFEESYFVPEGAIYPCDTIPDLRPEGDECSQDAYEEKDEFAPKPAAKKMKYMSKLKPTCILPSRVIP